MLTDKQIRALRRWSGHADGERLAFIQEERAMRCAEQCGPLMVAEMLDVGVLADGEDPIDALRRLIVASRGKYGRRGGRDE